MWCSSISPDHNPPSTSDCSSPKGRHTHMLKQTMTWVAMAVLSVLTAQAQQGRWAPADMPPRSSYLTPSDSGRTPTVITTKSRRVFSPTIFGALFQMEHRMGKRRK